MIQGSSSAAEDEASECEAEEAERELKRNRDEEGVPMDVDSSGEDDVEVQQEAAADTSEVRRSHGIANGCIYLTRMLHSRPSDRQHRRCPRRMGRKQRWKHRTWGGSWSRIRRCRRYVTTRTMPGSTRIIHPGPRFVSKDVSSGR